MYNIRPPMILKPVGGKSLPYEFLFILLLGISINFAKLCESLGYGKKQTR